jgi:hypothetical protein
VFMDLDRRLGETAERAVRCEKLQRRIAELESEGRETENAAQRLKGQVAKEDADVKRLEGISLTGLFYDILGSKEEQLQKERQEALAAELKYGEAVRRRTALLAELEQARREAAPLTGAAAERETLLKEKEAAISGSAGEGARELFRLGEREQQLRWNLQQLHEARSAGHLADAALARVIDHLESAGNWGTWDMLGGGLIATAAKHSRIDDARSAAYDAQAALSTFRRELKDIAADVYVDKIAIDGFSKFADFFFDGLIADWVVQNRINNSLESVRSSRNQVAGLLQNLDRQIQQTGADLEALQGERARFIERYHGD